MRHFDVHWMDILSMLPAWESLPLSSRWMFLNEFEPAGTAVSRLGDHAVILEEAGLAARVSTNPNKVRVPEKLKPFRRVMRAMERNPVFDDPSRECLANYLRDHFSKEECWGFLGHRSWQRTIPYAALIEQVTALRWLKRFQALSSIDEAMQYEKDHGGLAVERAGHFYKPGLLRAAQAFLQGLMDTPAPIALRDLQARFPNLSETQLQIALTVGIRYLLIFPSLRADDLEPVVGIWPDISRRLHRPAARLPEPRSPEHRFCMPFLVEDMTILLAACAAQPLRLRANDHALFAKAQRDIEARLIELPDWITHVLHYAHDRRVSVAEGFLYSLGFAASRGRAGRELRMEATKKGLQWLGGSAKERLKAILDVFRKTVKNPSSWHSTETDFLPWQLVAGAGNERHRLYTDALVDSFGGLEKDVFLPMNLFASYLAQQKNPLIEEEESGSPDAPLDDFGEGFFEILSRWASPAPSRERLEEKWGTDVTTFLAERLIPFGGASLGWDRRNVCFAMNSVGRYMLGLEKDFEYEAEEEADIIVQPNFDVVFLAPSPVLEATLGRMAERVGRNVGVLFKITKPSIFAAAGTGMTAAQALGTLRKASSKPIPANVEREIKGWFGQCRRVTMRRSVIIRCPDAETAARVRSAGRKNVSPISDTVLELHDETQRSQFQRKLREMGVFMTTGDAD